MVTGKWFWQMVQQPYREEHQRDAVLRAAPREFGKVESLGKSVLLQVKHFFPYNNGINEEIKAVPGAAASCRYGKSESVGDAALPRQEERSSGGWSRGLAQQGAAMGMSRRLVERKCQ